MTKRKVEIFQEGVWVSTSLRHIKNGDRFRIFEVEDGKEGSGKLVGGTEFTAEGDAYLSTLAECSLPEDQQASWTVLGRLA